MPLLKIESNVSVPDEKQQALLAALSKTVVKIVGKPEQYVMVTFGKAAVQMSGADGDAAFVDVRSIGGLTDDVNRKLTQQICHLLRDSLGISPDRIYVNFIDVKAGNWGWNGNTFG